MAGQANVVKFVGAPERRFDQPYRPLGLRVANHAGRVLRRVRSDALSFDESALFEAARERSGGGGATEFTLAPGDAYLDGLRNLLASLEEEARLTPAGRYFAREQVITSLLNRVGVGSALRAEPDLSLRSLSPALVIVGLPRSGTTLLQHLLARDPAHRVLRHWEAARPAAARGPEEDDAAKRATDRSLRLLDYLAPDARVIHPVDTQEPTECVTLFANSFASLELATINQVPSYLSWCLRSNFQSAYEEYALQLRVLESHEAQSRWLLKSPAHLFWLPELLTVLPGAKIIQIHRDPLDVLGSFCSLSAVLSGIGSDKVDLRGLGAEWAPVWAEGLARAEAARSQWPEDQFIDVDYADLLKDPMGEVQRIYRRFTLDLPVPTRTKMEEFLASHVQHAKGVHRYSLDQFGLDREAEADRFAPFRRNV